MGGEQASGVLKSRPLDSGVRTARGAVQTSDEASSTGASSASVVGASATDSSVTTASVMTGVS